MQGNSKYKKKKLKGFTLIELLIVIAIIGIITSIIIISLSSATNSAKDSKAIAQLSQIPSKIAMDYYAEGSYDFICEDASNFSTQSGLTKIQEELSSRSKTIECYAEGDNYCISSQLNTGEYYCIKNNSRFTALTACTSATEGCSLTVEEEGGCEGYLYNDECWYYASDTSSCDDVCLNHGGCVEGNWNDDSECSVCGYFLGISNPMCLEQNLGGSPAAEDEFICYYRAEEYGPQDCWIDVEWGSGGWTTGLKRLCVCEN